MKRLLTLVIAIVLVLGVSPILFADETETLDVDAFLPHGVSLADPYVLSCDEDPGDGNPWTLCDELGSGATMDFGTLTHLLDDNTNAGCFFAKRHFKVYLYPDAWGGAGYEIKQQFTWDQDLLGDSEKCLVVVPVYSSQDAYAGAGGQGDMPATADLGDRSVAINNSVVYTSDKPGTPVIVRAEYGIPPYPASGDPNDNAPGWVPLSKKQETGTYGGTVTFTITEF